ncbi:hypothetical protein [Parasphingorhabdus sp.]|uniref:hypothetical protein n=1 Tax=Parasphingorhabdus sp. TaxID=2709688 RepID=UPI003001A552
MSHPHDPVVVSPVAVDSQGCIRAFGLRFWSSDLYKFAGRSLMLCVPAAPHMTAIVASMKGKKLCDVDLIEDTGFADPSAARTLVALERAASQAQKALKTQAIVDLIDHRIQSDRYSRSVIRRLSGLLSRKLPGFMGRAFNKKFGRDNMAEQKVLDRDHLISEFGNIIFGHGQTSFCGESHQLSEAGDAAHRLYEGGQ